MALKPKPLKGVAGALLTPNTIADGGGLSSLLVPYKFTGLGAVAALGIVGAVGMTNEGTQQRNRAKMGKITGATTPARMSAAGVGGSGAIQAMYKASEGNPQVFSAMAETALRSGGIPNKMETYGATTELVSALYGMGRG